jgi:GWxTD domain-containing protein
MIIPKTYRRLIKLIKFIFIVLSLAIFNHSCKTAGTLGDLNLAHIYNPEGNIFHPQYFISHTGTKTSHLTVNIDNAQLLYFREIPDQYFTAQFSLHYRLFRSLESRSIIDSATVFFSDTLFSEHDYIVSRNLPFSAEIGNDYWMYLEINDLNRPNRQSTIISVEKRHTLVSPFFYLDIPSGEQVFPPFLIGESGKFTIHYFDSADFELNVTRYDFMGTLPPPPFVEAPSVELNANLIADTTTILGFDSGVGHLTIDLPGIYRLYNPLQPHEGFLLNFQHFNFPYITHATDMISPLRYITTHDEYTQLVNTPDARRAIDRFWTRTAGNPDRAREMIKRFYNRVEYANIFFSSHVGGWQTDRGMIYIVIGPPDMVFKTDTQEIWYYYENIKSSSARFVFTRFDNIYSPNHYLLIRNPGYKNIWDNSVENWRR